MASTHDIKKIIGQRIRQVRKESGRSQEEFSTLLDLDQTTLSQIELGESGPSLNALEFITKEFGVTFEWLTSPGTDPMPQEKRGEGLIDDTGLSEQLSSLSEKLDWIKDGIGKLLGKRKK